MPTEGSSRSSCGNVTKPLTLLAPDIVEAILGGRQPAEMTLAVLMQPFPVVWETQAKAQYKHELPYMRQK